MELLSPMAFHRLSNASRKQLDADRVFQSTFVHDRRQLSAQLLR
jgi:hypothetical protein